ncbi:MAG: hypothetical protein PVJ39_18450 [Gammaproteobacteria bacterium]|jgi:hypothetical protein
MKFSSVRTSWNAIVVFAVLLSACAQQSQNLQQNRNAPPTSAPEDQSDVAVFNRKIEKSINAGDSSAVFDRLDIAKITEAANNELAVIFGRPLLNEQRTARLADRIEESVKGIIKNGGRWDFVRVMQSSADEQNHDCLIRLTTHDGGLSYLKLRLRKTGDDYSISDIYRYNIGMSLTETIVHLYNYTKIIDRNVKYQILEKKDDYEKRFKEVWTTVKLFNSAYLNNDYDRVMDHYNNLPAELKGDTLFLVSLIELAGAIDNEKYKEALALMHKYYDGQSMQVYLIDYYFFNGQYDAAKAEIDKLEKLVGPESGLDVLRASMAVYEKDYNTAMAYAKQALQKDADNKSAYDLLYDLFLDLQRYDDVVLILDIMENKFDYSYDRTLFEDEPDYAGFVKSEAYQTWSKKLQ